MSKSNYLKDEMSSLENLDTVMKRLSSVASNADYSEYPRLEELVDPNWQYHNTQQLLDNYRTFQWRLEQMIVDEHNEARETELISHELRSSLSYFTSPEYIAIEEEAKKNLEHRHKNLSTVMVQIALALTSIKKYDDYGEMYYNVLMELYVRGKKPTAKSVAIKLNISRSRLYDYKDEALKLMSTCLWSAPGRYYENILKCMAKGVEGEYEKKKICN